MEYKWVKLKAYTGQITGCKEKGNLEFQKRKVFPIACGNGIPVLGLKNISEQIFLVLSPFTEPVPALARHLPAVYCDQAVHNREWSGSRTAASGGSLQTDQVPHGVKISIVNSTPKEETN